MNIPARFNRETAHHQMTVLHDDGLYKHLRFLPVHPDPKKRSSAMWFDIITWPHNLVVRGDYGDTYAFTRTEDMLGFFRESAWQREPNLHYWAEKLTTDRDSVTVYNEQIMRANIADAVEEELRCEGSLNCPDLREAVQEQVIEQLCGDESQDRHFVDDFKYWRNADDAYAYPRPEPNFTFESSWEWKLTDYDWAFQWACHALIWGEEYYRLGRRPDPLPEPKPTPKPAVDVEPDAGTETEPRGIAAGTARRRPTTTVHLPGDEPEERSDA